jgi:hypothetical protein
MTKLRQAKVTPPFVGVWHIYEMELWDEDYFNMETQAYIEIKPNNQGEFQFGLVTGYLDGYLEKIGEQERFTFTWQGNDEMDEASGSGWIQLISEGEIEGLINFHHGDKSLFQAKKANS